MELILVAATFDVLYKQRFPLLWNNKQHLSLHSSAPKIGLCSWLAKFTQAAFIDSVHGTGLVNQR